jgi:hypothetical protein
MHYHLIYPDDYNPTEKQLRSWLKDDIANGECMEPGFRQEDVEAMPLDIVVRTLNQTGKVTIVEVKERINHG